MKTALKLVFIYFGFQILAALLAMMIGALYLIVTVGNTDGLEDMVLSPTLLLGILFMTIYLWKAGYISTEKVTWSIVSVPYMVLTIIMYAAVLVLMEFVMINLEGIPDLMENTFNIMQANWMGILGIAILGPILEELLFRGAITKALLKKYKPGTAIVISALVFGIFHINPAQVISATLIGLLLGWIYYKTASLIPCILIHILNNSLSVVLSLKYPDVENTQLLLGDSVFYALVAAALIVFAITFVVMRKTTVPYPWKEDKNKIESLNN